MPPVGGSPRHVPDDRMPWKGGNQASMKEAENHCFCCYAVGIM